MKQIKTIAFAVLSAFFFGNASVAQELPVPSQKQTLMQRVGLADFTVEYSRPSAKGRVIFGDLVPFDQVWRTGANKATSIEFNTDITVEGKALPAGKYAIFTIPKLDGNWKVMFNSNHEQWGTGDYDETLNVLTLDVVAKRLPVKVETFTIQFADVVGDQATLHLAWAESAVSLSIIADSKEMAMENINARMNEINSVYRDYNSIARYYLEIGKSAEALEMAQKSVDLEKQFWNVKTLSEAYAANEDYKNAIQTAEESLKMAKEAEYMPYVKMNEANLARWKAMK
jgi:tetratricopeptide (TPR) repeat protein